MGRREQKERERQRAAASCQMLERFLLKKSKTGEVSSELNDSSVQNEVQPSLQTTPVTDTSPPPPPVQVKNLYVMIMMSVSIKRPAR